MSVASPRPSTSSAAVRAASATNWDLVTSSRSSAPERHERADGFVGFGRAQPRPLSSRARSHAREGSSSVPKAKFTASCGSLARGSHTAIGLSNR